MFCTDVVGRVRGQRWLGPTTFLWLVRLDRTLELRLGVQGLSWGRCDATRHLMYARRLGWSAIHGVEVQVFGDGGSCDVTR
jgi:hypothetical protein